MSNCIGFDVFVFFTTGPVKDYLCAHCKKVHVSVYNTEITAISVCKYFMIVQVYMITCLPHMLFDHAQSTLK